MPATLPGTFREQHGHFVGPPNFTTHNSTTSIPGNNLHDVGNAFKAEIIYFAKAKIDVAFKHDLKSRVQFVVNEKFDRLVQPAYGENNKSFMFVDGRLTAKVWLDKNVYFPGNFFPSFLV